jgi:DNA replication and repair protein RecF
VWLSWLELDEWRSHPTLAWSPDPGVNVLVGPNGAGKTSILEAVAYLSAVRSFRGSPDEGLIRVGAERAVVRGGFEKPAGESTVEIEIPRRGRRRILVNGKRPARQSAVAHQFPVVAFLPDDLDLVKGSASSRRVFLDDLGSRLAPGYGAALSEYESVLRQRNALLRQEGPAIDPVSLEVWDERLVGMATMVWAERVELVDGIAPELAAAHDAVSGGADRLGIGLDPAWGEPRGVVDAVSFDPDAAAGRLANELVARRRRELEQRTTTVGPHRDELHLDLGGRPARAQASQGEQRSVAVGMRVASYQVLADRHHEPPILLLDDIFSELDDARTAAVANLLPRGQVLVTTTRHDEVPGSARRWQVSEGTVK